MTRPPVTIRIFEGEESDDPDLVTWDKDADGKVTSIAIGPIESDAEIAARSKLTAVTVRLTDADYRRLKQFGLDRRLKSQTILVEAIRRYLDAEGEAP